MSGPQTPHTAVPVFGGAAADCALPPGRDGAARRQRRSCSRGRAGVARRGPAPPASPRAASSQSCASARPEPGRVTLGVHHRAHDRRGAACLGDGRRALRSRARPPAWSCPRCWSGTARCCPRRSRATSSTTPTPPARGGARLHVFDPTGCTGLPHAPWSPIAAARSWEGARRTAARLLGVGEHGAGALRR